MKRVKSQEEISDVILSSSEEIKKWEARLKSLKDREMYARYHISYYRSIIRDVKRLFSKRAFLRFLRLMFNKMH